MCIKTQVMDLLKGPVHTPGLGDRESGAVTRLRWVKHYRDTGETGGVPEQTGSFDWKDPPTHDWRRNGKKKMATRLLRGAVRRLQGRTGFGANLEGGGLSNSFVLAVQLTGSPVKREGCRLERSRVTRLSRKAGHGWCDTRPFSQAGRIICIFPVQEMRSFLYYRGKNRKQEKLIIGRGKGLQNQVGPMATSGLTLKE